MVGKRIRTLIAWFGVPTHTTGRVVSADEDGGCWTVAVHWDFPVKPRQMEVGGSKGELFLGISGEKPLVDWFSKSEYRQYLVEIDGKNK